jgi:peptidoglycan/xylan/chitin deacetylase (PgdA/CDA1 family)
VPPAPPVKANLNRASGKGPGGARITTGTSAVALTFDDGPWPESTPQLLDLLDKYQVQATFCVLGKHAQTHPDLIQRIHAEGHTLCNHSWRHDMALASRGEAAIRDDLTATSRAIHEAVPNARISYFRAPGGHFDNGLTGVAKDMGMTSIYWHVDTRDWEISKYGYGESMVKQIRETVQSEVRQGSIILSHDRSKPDTVAAYDELLPWLKQNYELTALPTGGIHP